MKFFSCYHLIDRPKIIDEWIIEDLAIYTDFWLIPVGVLIILFKSYMVRSRKFSANRQLLIKFDYVKG